MQETQRLVRTPPLEAVWGRERTQQITRNPVDRAAVSLRGRQTVQRLQAEPPVRVMPVGRVVRTSPVLPVLAVAVVTPKPVVLVVLTLLVALKRVATVATA